MTQFVNPRQTIKSGRNCDRSSEILCQKIVNQFPVFPFFNKFIDFILYFDGRIGRPNFININVIKEVFYLCIIVSSR